MAQVALLAKNKAVVNRRLLLPGRYTAAIALGILFGISLLWAKSNATSDEMFMRDLPGWLGVSFGAPHGALVERADTLCRWIFLLDHGVQYLCRGILAAVVTMFAQDFLAKKISDGLALNNNLSAILVIVKMVPLSIGAATVSYILFFTLGLN